MIYIQFLGVPITVQISCNGQIKMTSTRIRSWQGDMVVQRVLQNDWTRMSKKAEYQIMNKEVIQDTEASVNTEPKAEKGNGRRDERADRYI